MTVEGKASKKEALLAGLAMHTGTTRWFLHWSGHLVYTEGVQYLAEQAGAYWLIDLVASWCPHEKIRDEDFVVRKLTVDANHTAIAAADDGNENALFPQTIEFTDFPPNEVTLYLTEGTPLLPNEY